MPDKEPRNERDEPHGLWNHYHMNIHKSNEPILWYKGYYINGIDLGYWIEREIIHIYYAR